MAKHQNSSQSFYFYYYCSTLQKDVTFIALSVVFIIFFTLRVIFFAYFSSAFFFFSLLERRCFVLVFNHCVISLDMAG